MKPTITFVKSDTNNTFSVINKVAAALRKAKQDAWAQEFELKAIKCKTFDEMISLALNYVDAS